MRGTLGTLLQFLGRSHGQCVSGTVVNNGGKRSHGKLYYSELEYSIIKL